MRRFNAFRHVFFIACLLLSNVILSASVIESVNGETGDRSWENANIWVGEVVPGAADTVIINGLVTVYTPVPETFTACAKLTVNSGGILRDYWAGVLHVNGDMINNGTVENSYDGTYHLFLKVSGNITNNGVWKNAVTTLNGSEVQHLSGSGEFSGNEFVSENSADTLVADTDLLFYTTTIDLNNDRLELQGNQLSLTGTGYSGGTCYLSESELIGGNGEIYANSYGVLANSVINDVTLTGIVQVANGCEFKGTVTVGDTLNNTWGDGATLDVKGNLVNNGVIRDANSFYLLTLNIDGNLTNNGEWTNYTTNLSGKNDQHLMFSSIFSGTYLNDTDSSSSIFADSDISFFTTFVELDSSILCLQGYKLSLTGTGYSGETCYLSEAELIGGNGEIYANSYGVLVNSVINDVTLTGIVQVANGCEFKGTVTVGDTLNNTWSDGALLDVKGNLVNNGVIRDANSFYLLTLNIDGNLTNNGEWTNTITNLSGSNVQHLAISSPFSGH
ncbi:MAG: hypothetical protein JXR87_05045, partial [Candidatus Marinimicrobia bacterium]|nr:hypothetical protein [Candidatus Neomarinimicrobiota bacterium]